LYKRARRDTPGGVESNIRWFKPHPFYVDSGDGAYLYDVDGNKVLDFMMGFGAMILGHNNRDVALEVIRQLESGSMLGVSTPLFTQYIQQLREAVPSIKKARLTNSGTEATMHALRAARAYTGKDKIAKAEGAYHGAHDYVLQSLDMDARTVRRMKGYRPVTYGRGVPKAIADITVIYPYNDVEATAEILEQNADDLAAVIIEPVLCGPGVVIPKGHYLWHLRRITRKLGIVLIFDEVLTGFRLGLGGAQEYYGVKPDLTTFGKIAGGGFQLAGFGGESQIMDVITPGGGWKRGTFHAGTYNGHPVAVAAGLKCLQILDENPGIYEHINTLGRKLFKGLQDHADDRRIPAWVEWVGSMGTIYFTTKDEIRDFRDTLDANSKRWWNWFIHCLGNDVLFGIPNVGERGFLCAEHTEEDVEHALEVADDALAAIQREAKRTKTRRLALAAEGATRNQRAAAHA
ncbi:MAG: glutamate-1-semialdehyde 2,1-aminomutase, partial [Candidatus Thermoplasmatota archaeon]